MTNAEAPILVFKDRAGDYFILPRELWERGRVPAEHKAEVERLLAEAKGEDVCGYILSFLGDFLELFAIHTGAAFAVSAEIPVLRLPES